LGVLRRYFCSCEGLITKDAKTEIHDLAVMVPVTHSNECFVLPAA
jgi:hypothetical protein